MNKSIEDDINDPVVCKAIVMSLRTLLHIYDETKPGSDIDKEHLRQIAYVEDKGTKAFKEFINMK